MRKQKYYYNTKTLSYEKAKSTWRWRLVKSLAYLGSVIFFSILFTILIVNSFDTPKEQVLRRELNQVKSEYQEVQLKINDLEDVLDELAKRDENIYRVIFEADPISNEVRKSGFGGSNRYEQLTKLPFGKLIKNTKLKVEQLEKQFAIQSKSYDELNALLERKESMLMSIPAIQPILTGGPVHLSSGYGMRYHPIYKTRRMHTGLDFSAPIGTPIHATGNGVVEAVDLDRSGYGYHVTINHDFGYKTIYAHMSRIDVKKGQKIKRGEVLGLVGNTGTSTAPHLHYEVLQNDKKINPVHFFFNDVTPQEYEAIIEQAELSNQSFD